MNLRDTIARAIYGSIHPIGGWGTWVDEGGDSPYHAHADAVLAALGLDDLDAAIERGALALFEDHYGEPHGPAYAPLRSSRWWSYAEDSIRAALTPPEGPA